MKHCVVENPSAVFEPEPGNIFLEPIAQQCIIIQFAVLRVLLRVEPCLNRLSVAHVESHVLSDLNDLLFGQGHFFAFGSMLLGWLLHVWEHGPRHGLFEVISPLDMQTGGKPQSQVFLVVLDRTSEERSVPLPRGGLHCQKRPSRTTLRVQRWMQPGKRR